MTATFLSFPLNLSSLYVAGSGFSISNCSRKTWISCSEDSTVDVDSDVSITAALEATSRSRGIKCRLFEKIY